MCPTWTRARGWADVEHIDAGKLDERVLVLALQETAENVWRWVEIRKTWASVEQSTRRNNWSVHGIGTTGVTLTVRRQDITLGHALQWRGQHCFIASLLPFGRNHLKVEAALVAVSECEAAAEMSAGRTELNRPTLTPSTALSFPGVVAEKYRRSQEGDLYTTVETALILNVPKAVPELAEGRTVTIDGPAAGSYEVQAVHNLDPNRVEYEILRKGDA